MTANTTKRAAALAIGSAILALGTAAAGVLIRRWKAAGDGHAAPDLALDRHRPGAADRAPAAFRPDPTAIPTIAEREALRPATGAAPGFAADRGSTIG